MTQKRRNTVTQEQVNAAADKLVSQGSSVSMNTVREVIGGSFTTLGPMIKKWKEEKESLAEDTALPDHVLETMKRSALQLWRSANEQANEAIEKTKEEANTKVSLMESEVKEYASELRRLEGQAVGFEETRTKLESAIQKSDAKICELTAENAVLESKLADKESLISDLKDQLVTANTKIDGLQTELIDIAKKSSKRK